MRKENFENNACIMAFCLLLYRFCFILKVLKSIFSVEDKFADVSWHIAMLLNHVHSQTFIIKGLYARIQYWGFREGQRAPSTAARGSGAAL